MKAANVAVESLQGFTAHDSRRTCPALIELVGEKHGACTGPILLHVGCDSRQFSERSGVSATCCLPITAKNSQPTAELKAEKNGRGAASDSNGCGAKYCNSAESSKGYQTDIVSVIAPTLLFDMPMRATSGQTTFDRYCGYDPSISHNIHV